MFVCLFFKEATLTPGQVKLQLTVNIMMLGMNRLSLHLQFLCCKVWQFAAGASTAGFLEKAAPADLERELRTFKYPAISSRDRKHFAVNARRNRAKEGGKRSAALCNIVTSSSTALLPSPAGDAECYVRVTHTQRRDRNKTAVKHHRGSL